MNKIQDFSKRLRHLLSPHRLPLECAEPESEAAFYASLERQFIEVHERQRQRTTGLWRASDECPSTFRIKAGELSDGEMKHIKTCHLCWLIYDLSRFERSIGMLRVRARRTAHWIVESPMAPILVGLVIVIGLIAIHLRSMRQAEDSQEFVQSPRATSPSAVKNAATASHSPKEYRRELELELRKLPPEIEMERRLGPRLGREYESLQDAMAIFVPQNSDLGRRLSAAWLQTLRTGGNGLFIDIVRYQMLFAPKVQPPSLVRLAEMHAQMAQEVSPKHLRSFLQIQARVVSEAQKEAGRTGGMELVGVRLLEETEHQRDFSTPKSLGQEESLRAAGTRRDISSSLARR